MGTSKWLWSIALLLAVSGCDGSRSAPTRVQAEGVELAVSVEPPAPRVGQNMMWIELRDASGAPVASAEVEAKVSMHAMGAMPAMGGPAVVREVGEGRYRAEFTLDMGGTWNVEIAAKPARGPEAIAEGSLTVGTPGVRLESSTDGRAGGLGGHAHGEAAGMEMEGEGESTRHPAEFQVPVGRLQRVGVRVAPAEMKTLRSTVRAAGRVVAEETTLEDVALKVRGWVGDIYADAVGEAVTRGETLFTVYSPELYAAQEEYMQALRSQQRARESSAPDRADYLVRAARNRLRLWDIADRDLERIAAAGAPLEQLPIRAPVSGYVVEKHLARGSAFEAGDQLYRIAPLSNVWIEAEVYEHELPLVSAGQRATVSLPYQVGQEFEATIAYVYPTLDPMTRTARVRLEVANPDLALRPDMFANVRIHADRGERLLVPQTAVLHAGERSFVFVEVGDGRFRPQQVDVGLSNGDEVEIVAGLEAGDPIVVSGTFLIASESRLRAALERW